MAGRCANLPATAIRWRTFTCRSPDRMKRRKDDGRLEEWNAGRQTWRQSAVLAASRRFRLPLFQHSNWLMQAFVTLARRELAGYFLSLTGYIIIASAMFLIGFSFVDMIRALQHEPTLMPVTELFYGTWYFWLILLLTTPA